MNLSPQPKFSQTFHLPLRMLLILVFVSQILGAVGLVGYLSFRNGQKAVNNLATQLRQELTARIERELRGYFETPHNINRLNASSLAFDLFDLDNATFGENQFYQQMRVSPTVAFIYCGSAENGEFFGVLRSPEDGSLQLSYSNASTNYRRRYYSLDVRGSRTRLLRESDQPYDARQRPWFKAAVAAEEPTWTDIYIAFTTGLPNITASLPVYNQSSRDLMGVCATDVVLPKEFRTFLQRLEIGDTGQAFVVDRQGYLISNSTDEPLMVGDQETAQTLLASDSQDYLVQKTADYLASRFNGFERITRAQRLEFKIGGKRQFLEVLPFQDGFGLDWLIVVVVPEADFMAQINANTRNTVILCIAALLLAIAVSIVTAQLVTRPILNISKASGKLAQGQLDQQIAPSFITEIGRLAQSFNRMTSQLQQSFSALRQSESMNRGIVNTIPDLMIRSTGNGVYLDIIGSNHPPGVSGAKEFSPGKTVQESLPPKLAAKRMHHIRKALATGELQVYEHQILIDDQLRYEEIRILVLGENEVLMMVRDVSIRRKAEDALRIAEENFRSIFENALEGIFQSSPSGRFLNVNPALAQIYGYDSPQEMIEQITDIGKQLYVDPERRTEFRELLEQQGFAKDFEYRCYCKDGSIVWTQIDARCVRDKNGNLLYYEGIVQDITERKRREEELMRQLEELQIEIDQKEREEEVNTLTASNYFQEVQEEISNVNLDEFWS
ncbi:MAG: PAS domain S-box protein [Cyanobacteria bacterium P01_F01_bin.150]